MISKLPFLFLLAFFFLGNLFGQLPFNSKVLNHTHPKEEDWTDLQQLEAHFAGPRLIGLGESTHGTKEFFEMRHRLFKYLVLHHGYTIFFLEADYSNCLRVNRYINGAEDDLKEVTGSLGLWPWITEEFAQMIKWMREYNQTQPSQPLRFVGCDLQQVNRTIEEIDRIIQQHNPALIDTSLYVPLTQREFYVLKEANDLMPYRKLLANRQAIQAQLSLNESDRFTYETLLRHLHQVIENKANPKFSSYRDLKMGENILHHLDHRPKEKGIFWAHNVHIANFYRLKKKEYKSFICAGGVLKKQLGEQYLIIGQDFDSGAFNAYHPYTSAGATEKLEDYQLGEVHITPLPNTLARLFDQSNDSLFFFLLHDVPPKEVENIWIHNIGAVYYPPTRIKAKKPTTFYLDSKVFDAMILIKQTHATNLIRKEKGKRNKQ